MSSQRGHRAQRRGHVVTGHYSDWSLYEIGLTEGQLRAVTGLSLHELRIGWPVLPRNLRQLDLEEALRLYAHVDISKLPSTAGGELNMDLIIGLIGFIIFIAVLSAIFSIADQLKKQNVILETHTRLLAAIANGTNPEEAQEFFRQGGN
jgi:hypothetical protein